MQTFSVFNSGQSWTRTRLLSISLAYMTFNHFYFVASAPERGFSLVVLPNNRVSCKQPFFILETKTGHLFNNLILNRISLGGHQTNKSNKRKRKHIIQYNSSIASLFLQHTNENLHRQQLKMLTLCTLLSYLVALTTSLPTGNNVEPTLTPEPRIVGGKVSNAIPWMASLTDIYGFHTGGAALIHKYWVLTAGHCVEGGNLPGVWLGGADRTQPEGFLRFNVSKVFVNPGFVSEQYKNDIALLLLERPATGVLTAKLNRKRSNEVAGKICTAAGWGRTSAEQPPLAMQLMSVDLQIVDQKICSTSMGQDAGKEYNLCAGPKEGGKDACIGDSGGPFYVGNTLLGIISWGIGCGSPGLYGVYTRVSSFTDWINNTIRDFTPKK